MEYKPKVITGKVRGTGWPIDGHVLWFSQWDYDNRESWHLYGWEDSEDEAVLQTVFQTETEACLCPFDTLEKFAENWKAKKWEPQGSFCLPLDKVEVLEVKQEESTNNTREQLRAHGFDLTPRKQTDRGGILCLPLDKNLNGDVQAKHPDWKMVPEIMIPLVGMVNELKFVKNVVTKTADEIIQGTKLFCKEHSFVNEKKIGCIGASYGGFMTQYLQTKTDLFAAAISHAGISDHTSYWGEGYWGYSYSEVSMANEYPWTNKHLFVDQSPLYNADKIHTPLLFVHGTADNNVPVGESIQLYTALKLLGRPTAMVLVDGQDHHIIDYEKRLKWQNTIFAWFAKYLKDEPQWWDALYPERHL